MVAAGVIPIDRLTDVRAPVGEVAAKVSQEQLERVYGIRLPDTSDLNSESINAHALAVRLLRALALSRGWVAASGHPDETRAGRRILKDFVDGKILTCNPPPGASSKVVAIAKRVGIVGRNDDFDDVEDVDVEDLEIGGNSAKPDGTGGKGQVIVLDDADLELMDSLDIGDGLNRRGTKPVRAAHKFHKKPGGARSKSKAQGGYGYGYGVIATGMPRQVE